MRAPRWPFALAARGMPGLAVDGAAELGGVEGIYGINALPLRWTGAAAGR